MFDKCVDGVCFYICESVWNVIGRCRGAEDDWWWWGSFLSSLYSSSSATSLPGKSCLLFRDSISVTMSNRLNVHYSAVKYKFIFIYIRVYMNGSQTTIV